MILEAWRALHEAPEIADPTRVFCDVLNEPAVDDATWRGYASEVKTHLVPTLGDLPLTELTRARVQAFLRELPHRESELHLGQAISRSMVVKVYRRLSSIVKYGRIAGLIDGDPMLGNALPPPVRRSARHAAEVTPADRALSTAETDAVLAWLAQAYGHHPAYRARFQLAAETGLRQAEACGLTWDRVDLDGRLVVVHQQLVHEPHAHGCGPLDPATGVTPCTLSERRRTGNRRAPQVSAYRCPQQTGGGWWIDQDTKSHQQRRVPVTQDLTDALRRLADARPAPSRTQAERRAMERSRARSRYPVEHADLVFTAERGGHISKSLDNTLWHRALDGSGVSSHGRTVHALRHTAATSWIEAGLTLPNVQVLLGHSSLQVLQRYYGSVQASRVAVADQLAEYLARARAAN